MKKLFLAIASVLLTTFILAQDLPDFDAIKLESKEDYNTNADNAALKASAYLLSTPLEKNNLPRLRSMQYIIKWMSGTPNYSFTLDEKSTKFTKNNEDLLALYMAAMTNYVLQNKENAKDQDKIKLNAVKTILNYAKNKENKVKLNGELKKAIEADEIGKLEEYLNK